MRRPPVRTPVHAMRGRGLAALPQHCLLLEWEANDRLKREDPAAYEAMLLARLPTSKCCLCGESFKGFGHNTSPVREECVACDTCNGAIVLPQRIRKWSA